MKKSGIELFNDAKIIYPEKEAEAKDAKWYEHPAFKGVFLKDLVTAEDTNGQFSCHIVKVNAGCEVGSHLHEFQWELNETIAGNGIFILGDKEVVFTAGYTFVTPPEVEHTVIAEGNDLYLLAKFVPAL